MARRHLLPLVGLIGLGVGASARAGADATSTSGGVTVYTRTSEVEDLARDGDTLWVATRGGVEAYAIPGFVRQGVYTTAAGLASNHVLAIEGARPLRVRTARARCTLAEERFQCQTAPPLPVPEPAVAPLFRGARVTRTLVVTEGDAVIIGTAGQGLWLASAGTERRLTPEGEPCSNQLTALARFRGQLWLGSFDEGLCRFDGRRFHAPATPFRMVNDLLATPRALYVAASEGLFFTRDGLRFERVAEVQAGGVNRLAWDGRTLHVSTPAALFRLAGRRRHSDWRPLQSRALQAVSVAGGVVWLASEDRGVVRLRGGVAEPFDRASGLPSSWMVDIHATADGGAFAASLRHGLVRIEADGRHERVAGLPSDWLLHVGADAAGDGLWIGTQDGLVHCDAAGRITPLAGVAHPSVHDVLDLGEVVWVASEGGLTRHAR